MDRDRSCRLDIWGGRSGDDVGNDNNNNPADRWSSLRESSESPISKFDERSRRSRSKSAAGSSTFGIGDTEIA